MDNNQNKNSTDRSSDALYLERLTFNPELRKSWLNFFVTNFRVVILLIILLTALGLYSFQDLPKESNPEVKIPIAVVSTLYPGASPLDVEEQITKKIEPEIASLKGLSKITSNSANSVSSIVVEFDPKEDLEDAIRRLRDQVAGVEGNLPEDAMDPVVRQISFSDQPIITFVLGGPYSGFVLRDYAEEIKDELEKIAGVREVNVSGGDRREFEIAYDPQKLVFYGITADQANAQIKTNNLAFPAGVFEGDKFTYPVRSDARVFAAKDIADIPVGSSGDGSLIYLRDVAVVKEVAIEKAVYSRLSVRGSLPQDSVTIGVVKKTGGSVIETADEAKAVMDRMIKDFAPGVEYDTTINFAEYIRQDFEQLGKDFLLTLILVCGVLFLLVGLKEAFVAGLAIPLVFFATFGLMNLFGITLNFLSIFSLLLSLGLLVDDAIVVVSATKQYLRTGKFTPEEAVLLVLNDFKVVLTTTTLTTVWAFLPLLYSTGIIGEFIKSIPITVTAVLMSSLAIALMINHPLAAVLERIRLTKGVFSLSLFLTFCIALLFALQGSLILLVLANAILFLIILLIFWFERGGRRKMEENKRLAEGEWQSEDLIKQKLLTQGSHVDATFWDRLIHGIINFNRILPWYERSMRKLIDVKRYRWGLVLGVFVLFLISVGFLGTGIVRTEFFPSSDEDLIFINISGPTGMNLEETDKIARQVEEKLRTNKEILNFSTIVGASTGDSVQSGSSLASMVVRLTKPGDRDIASYEIASLLREDLHEISESTNSKIAVSSQQGGPPSGAAFEARIQGEDLEVLDRVAKDLEKILKTIPGVVNADISLKDAPVEYTFALRPEMLSKYGMNAAYVGSVLRMAISGTEVSQVLKGDDEIKIVARFSEASIPDLQALQNLQLVSPRGQGVFLKDVAEVELRPSVDTITRIDQRRTVLLSSDAEGGVAPVEILSKFQEKISKEYNLPEGYQIVYGGENEQNAESVESILRAMIIAALLIVSTLIIQFNSFRKAMIVLVTFPLALIGVFFGMAITQVPLSFPGLIGVLALFGIVVKNAIILIDKINLNLLSGIAFNDAVVDAGKSRLEAIFITSICTILGIVPVTLSNATWTALGTAIIFGLSLSSFLTLFVVPSLFVIFSSKSERKELS